MTVEMNYMPREIWVSPDLDHMYTEKTTRTQKYIRADSIPEALMANLNKESWSDAFWAIAMLVGSGEFDTIARIIKPMAWAADRFGHPVVIETYSMQTLETGDTVVTDNPDLVDHYDVMVRVEGEEPFIEHFDLTWEEAEKYREQYREEYPGAIVEDTIGVEPCQN